MASPSPFPARRIAPTSRAESALQGKVADQAGGLVRPVHPQHVGLPCLVGMDDAKVAAIALAGLGLEMEVRQGDGRPHGVAVGLAVDGDPHTGEHLDASTTVRADAEGKDARVGRAAIPCSGRAPQSACPQTRSAAAANPPRRSRVRRGSARAQLEDDRIAGLEQLLTCLPPFTIGVSSRTLRKQR